MKKWIFFLTILILTPNIQPIQANNSRAFKRQQLKNKKAARKKATKLLFLGCTLFLPIFFIRKNNNEATQIKNHTSKPRFIFGVQEYQWIKTNTAKKIQPIAPSECKVDEEFLKKNIFPSLSTNQFKDIKHLPSDTSTMLQGIFDKLDYPENEKFVQCSKEYKELSKQEARERVGKYPEKFEKTSITGFLVKIELKREIPLLAELFYRVNNLDLTDKTNIAIAKTLINYLLQAQVECYATTINMLTVVSARLNMETNIPLTPEGKLYYRIGKLKEEVFENQLFEFVNTPPKVKKKNRATWELSSDESDEEQEQGKIATVIGDHIKNYMRGVCKGTIGLSEQDVVAKDETIAEKALNNIFGLRIDHKFKKKVLKHFFNGFFGPHFTPEIIVNTLQRELTSNVEKVNRNKVKNPKYHIGIQGFQEICKRRKVNLSEIYTENYKEIKKEYIAGALVAMGIFKKA